MQMMSAVVPHSFLAKITDGETYQEIVPHSSDEGSSNSAPVKLPKEKKSWEKDALLAVKLDPAVLEAQVTLTKDEVNLQHSSELVSVEREGKEKRCYPSYEEVLSMQQAALLGLTPQQLMLLIVFVDTLRRQRQHTQRQMECAFCKKNGSPASWYTSHALRDRKRARCPVLRALRCPLCGATGDHAHTTKYCPQNIFSDCWRFN